jgi:hypothetical protein
MGNFKRTSFAIRVAVFEEEWRIAKQFSTVDAIEAFRMEVLSDGLEAILEQLHCRECYLKNG